MGISGKGMCGRGTFGKCMWKRKGKAGSNDGEGRPCASTGCKFQATWHPTHCCHACAKGLKSHGVMCEQRQQSPEAKMETSTAETMSFPVEVVDGRNLQIEWVRGEDPVEAAARFAQEHAIQRDELATIIDFIRHAEKVTPPTENEKAEDELMKDAVEDTAMKKALVEPEKVAAESAKDCRPCMRAGCEYQVTWHKTHCCNACEQGNGHGPACKRQRFERREEHEQGPPRFAFPVVLEDGRELRMEWTRGQDLEDVSKSFAKQHGLPEESVPQLLDAASCLDGMPSALRQLKDMGFGLDERVLRELLESCGNDVEKAVETLMQGM